MPELQPAVRWADLTDGEQRRLRSELAACRRMLLHPDRFTPAQLAYAHEHAERIADLQIDYIRENWAAIERAFATWSRQLVTWWNTAAADVVKAFGDAYGVTATEPTRGVPLDPAGDRRRRLREARQRARMSTQRKARR